MSDAYRSPDATSAHPEPATGRSGLAVAALITGIASLLLLWLWFVGIPLALVAIGLGIAALRRARAGAGGRGMAIAGLVLGAVTVVIAGILVAVGVSILNSDEGKDLRSCMNNAQTQQEQQDCSNRFNEDVNN
ncbi:DUF4190 domain-containing protein [Streptomyces antarcticus]|uniref:DUF4190 domain-containing protein n=1 Tax=Streptomyces antarcticus TaxID=2996458 RepID=UPI00226FCD27|nr:MULTISPECIES: DUF4190 domain-containing protein [unclassified Streptomyces]MCY0946866.1 DUF4190 domain-containing protein [Streptomyces sp. H34-AA3]MCZ4085634.1 DUF4190 domain-containing protein [Streptomyces sp. H34-S5]